MKRSHALLIIFTLLSSLFVIFIPQSTLAESNETMGWKKDVRLSYTTAGSTRTDLATDSKNRVHVVWVDRKDGAGVEGQGIFYKTYGGANWSNEIHLDAVRPEAGGSGLFSDSNGG